MKYIQANGVSLRYEMSGQGPTTLALLHEMGSSLETWDAAMPLLMRGRRVIRYDMRGAGLSEKIAGTATIDRMAGDLIGLLSGVGVTGKVALAGGAVGGGIALRVASTRPDLVGAMVVMSPSVGVPPAYHEALRGKVDAGEAGGMSSTVAEFEKSYPQELRDGSGRFEDARGRYLANDPRSFAAIYRMLLEMDLVPDLAAVKCPVLVIGGTHDPVRPVAASEGIAQKIPGAAFKILPSGHYMATQTPELVAETIDTFLRDRGF